MIRKARLVAGLVLLTASAAAADMGDPQIRTDHTWYPGELAMSSFARLQPTQAELYWRVVGVSPTTDEQKALAAWLWRNTHYYHGEEGAEDLWGLGFTKGSDVRSREYWTGYFAHGFGLCGTTHSQWIPEINALLGHNRGRGVGVTGHNSFEVFLTGGAYGAGKWALLDHDISTVIFNEQGTALLSIPEVRAKWKQLTDRSFLPQKQKGWLVCGLDARDGGVYADYTTAEYLAGYEGLPPMVHLRRGETLRRYLEPGLEDGKTFVFWGRNYGTGGIPGPERAQTWVNQPEKMYGSTGGTGWKPGQARYANAVYTYRPDFASGDYREGVIDEGAAHVTFEFYTPYIIGATPPNHDAWGIYAPGGRNGLLVRGKGGAEVSLSVDLGKTWTSGGKLSGSLDLTDLAKGRRQYFLRIGAPPASLRDSELTITTVCQANSATIPRLKDGGTTVRFQASHRAAVSAGPNLPQAQAHVVDGAFGTPRVTLEIASPRKEPVTAVHAAAHVLSGNPPAPEVKYRIDYSLDGGESWLPIVADWSVTRRGDEPKDFWSQSMCWGSAQIPQTKATSVRIRFSNDGGRRYARGEAHLVYRTPAKDGTKVTFAWTDDRGSQRSSIVFTPEDRSEWRIGTGAGVQTHWVEYQCVPSR